VDKIKSKMGLDRMLRIGIGAGIILIGLVMQYSWWFFGIFPLMAGIINRCPSFMTYGSSSCSIEPIKQEIKKD
jgi:hypothetical protein